VAENLIDDFRKQIDSIDQNIIENLSRRTEIVLKIGEIKSKFLTALKKLTKTANSRRRFLFKSTAKLFQPAVPWKNGFV